MMSAARERLHDRQPATLWISGWVGDIF